MSTILNPGTLGIFLCLGLLCSCATQNGVRLRLPPEMDMNPDAGRGGVLILKLQLEDGEVVPFGVDTGAPRTLLDRSLEPKLGTRLDTGVLWNFGVKQETGIYAAPKLFLGGIQLQTGPNVITFDYQQLSNPGRQQVRGILGMDCLRHYCLQLDFQAGKLRFLDPREVPGPALGKAIPLVYSSEGQSDAKLTRPMIAKDSLIGEKRTSLLIDTGDNLDGELESGLFQQALQARTKVLSGGAVQLDEARLLWLSQCTWNGNTYTNLSFGNGGDSRHSGNGGNLMGLRFLARHLVTLNFPKSMLYLKQTSTGPLVKGDMEATAKSANEFLKTMKNDGRLPGWSANDQPGLGSVYYHYHDSGSITFEVKKMSGADTYFFTLDREMAADSWKLEKAWRTNENGRTVEEYPVP